LVYEIAQLSPAFERILLLWELTREGTFSGPNEVFQRGFCNENLKNRPDIAIDTHFNILICACGLAAIKVDCSRKNLFTKS
jgi:hypothetical protein